jgi:hypothetical protein
VGSRFESLALKAFESGDMKLFREYIEKMIDCQIEEKEVEE